MSKGWPSIKERSKLLGMSHSTANYRLTKDIIFEFVVKPNNECFRCGGPMTRKNFSIEHIKPWRTAEEPNQAFFDLGNITFSHHSCNAGAASQPMKKGCGTSASYLRGCRCKKCKEARSQYKKSRYTPEKRHARYKKNGS